MSTSANKHIVFLEIRSSRCWLKARRFETRHGKPCLSTAALPSRFQFAQGQSTHAGIEVNMQLGLRARLTGTQRRKLLGVSEEKLDLEACFVPTIKRLRIQVGIGAEQHRSPLSAGIHHKHDTQDCAEDARG